MSSWANINSATCHLIERKVEWVDMKKWLWWLSHIGNSIFLFVTKISLTNLLKCSRKFVPHSPWVLEVAFLGLVRAPIGLTARHLARFTMEGIRNFDIHPTATPPATVTNPATRTINVICTAALTQKDFTAQRVGLNLLEASVWILKNTNNEWTLSPFNCWSWNAALFCCMFATIDHHVARCLYHRCEIILYCIKSSKHIYILFCETIPHPVLKIAIRHDTITRKKGKIKLHYNVHI